MNWTQAQAIQLCTELERIAPIFGGHVALTGGCLYKPGDRKDLDIMVYRSTDEPPFRWDEFFAEIELTHGIRKVADFGFVKKAERDYGGHTMSIDFMDPFGVYVPGTSEIARQDSFDALQK